MILNTRSYSGERHFRFELEHDKTVRNAANSLDIVKELIISQDLHNCEFHFLSHPAEINWRQKHADVFSKIANIASGIRFNNQELVPVLGWELVHSEPLRQLTSPETPLLSITSKVKAADDRICHLPMMNIHLDVPIDIRTLNDALAKLISADYYLLRTDRFYHIYGNGLMTEDEWKEWNLKFLMVDFLVSPRYIGHSLAGGCNKLRINAAKSLKTTVPHLVLQREHCKSLDYQEAKVFAVAKHTSQLTQRGEPYCRHLFEVEKHTMDIGREIGLPERELSPMRQAAVLHDSIEDTDTDYEDIVKLTGTKVADMVAVLSNDKRMPKDERDEIFLSK